jgi:fatty-acyl-CoA synthase
MKIAFSTLGCPDFSWTDIYSMAKDLGLTELKSEDWAMTYLL